MRRISIIALASLAFLAVPAQSVDAALNFDFNGERSGNPSTRFAGQGFIDGTASRYDFIEGNHVTFRKNMSILSQDNKVLTIVDHSKGIYYRRSTKGMAGIITTYSGPYQIGADQFEIHLETLDRESWLGIYRPARQHLTFSYRIKMSLEGEEFYGRVEADAELWMDPKYRTPAVPWGHQFGLKTGIEEFDTQIAKKLHGLGFPFRQMITVTRTIEGGERVTETLRTDVTRFGDSAFPRSGFDAPGGYVQSEPILTRPERVGAPVETAQAAPPPPPAASAAVPEPLAPIKAVDPKTATPLLVESMEVRVVNIDAVVTDKSGKHAPGLKREEFEVREGGQPREITNFLEVSSAAGTLAPRDATEPGAASAPATATGIERRSRKIIVFLDQNTLQFHNRNRMIDATGKFVKETMRPGDEAMIVTFDKGMKIVLQFTGDPKVIGEALVKLKGESVTGVLTSQRRTRAQNDILQLIIDAAQMGEPPRYADALGVCTVYAATVMHDANQTIGALQGLMTALSPIPGRKVLVLATEALPARAGEDMFIFLDGIREQFPDGRSQNPITEATKYDLAPKVQSLSDTANASGFTLYPVHARGLADDSVGAEVSGSLQMNFGMAVNAAADAARSNDTAPLLTLANRTGGRMSMGGNDFGVAFAGITADLENYYSIGYRPEGDRSGMPRSVVVKVANPDLKVRTKASFLERTLENEIEETVAAALFYPVDRNDLGITISTRPPETQADGTLHTKLRIDVPTASLALIPQGDDLAGSLVIYIGFVKADGGVSKIAKNSQQFTFPASSASRRKSITLELDVTADASTNRIGVGVLDAASKSTGYASTFIGAAPAAN